MEQIERVAQLCVGRAIGFYGLATVCIMVGFSFEPALALKIGACLVSLLASGLLFRALGAPRCNFRHTELWLVLDADARPPKASAQQVISQVLRRTYYWFFRHATVVAGGLWALCLLLWLSGSTEG